MLESAPDEDLEPESTAQLLQAAAGCLTQCVRVSLGNQKHRVSKQCIHHQLPSFRSLLAVSAPVQLGFPMQRVLTIWVSCQRYSTFGRRIGLQAFGREGHLELVNAVLDDARIQDIATVLGSAKPSTEATFIRAVQHTKAAARVLKAVS